MYSVKSCVSDVMLVIFRSSCFIPNKLATLSTQLAGMPKRQFTLTKGTQTDN